MTEYTLEQDRVVAYERAPHGSERFRTYDEFARLGRDWSGKTLVDLYNTLATDQGKEGVQRFMNRDAGRKRLWRLIQALPVQQTPATPEAHVERVSKKETVLRMVQQPSGATLDELMTATGWQAHSVRGFLSVQRKEYTIERIARTEDVLAYYATKKPDQK